MKGVTPMYSNLELIILAGVAGLFLGVFVMLVGFKLWIAMVLQPPYTEEDDWPEWSIEVDDESM